MLHIPLAAVAAGALTYALGGFSLSSINLYVLTQTIAWAPLFILGFRRAVESGRPRAVALAALALAIMVSTTGIEVALQACLLAVVVAPPMDRPRFLRPAACAGLGVTLCAAVILPLLSAAGEGDRGSGLPAWVVLSNSVHPIGFLQVLIGGLFVDIANLSGSQDFYNPSPEMERVAADLRASGGRAFTCDPEASESYWQGRHARGAYHEAFSMAALSEALAPSFNMPVGVRTALSIDRNGLAPVTIYIHELEGAASRFDRPVTLISDESDEIVLEATAESATTLNMLEPFAKGWRDTVNGTGPITRTESSYRAVPLEVGRNVVRMVYDPPGLRLGMGITALAFMLLLGLLFVETLYRIVGPLLSASQKFRTGY